MPERASTREWPLVAFTIALQGACGMALAAILLHWNHVVDQRLVVGIFPLVAVGLVASLFHVGRPLFAWRAARNALRSRLSREVVLTVAFAAAALAYAWQMTLIMGIVTAVFGLATVVSSADIYLLPGQPLWNSAWLPASFGATAILLGGLIAVAAGERSVATMALTVIGTVVLMLAAVGMLRRLMRLRQACDRVELPAFLATRQYLYLGIQFVLAGILPLALAVGWTPDVLAWWTVAAAVVGAVLARMTMYSLTERLPRF